MELSAPVRGNPLIGPYDDSRAGGLAPLRTAPWTPFEGSAPCATSREGVPLGAPALSLAPDRRNHQAGIHSFLFPAPGALRRPPRSGLFSSGRRASRPAPRRL